MSFSPKAWQNAPDTSTPINAAALIDMETRLSAYIDSGTSHIKAVCIYTGGAYPPRPSGYGSVEFIGPTDPGASALNNDTWIPTA